MSSLMKTLILFCLANAVFSENVDVPGKLGGNLVLKPDCIIKPPSSILWRMKREKVADFDVDFGTDITYYGDFKGRTTLDTTTGELRITGLKKSDEGVYSVELNSVWLEKTYTLSVMNAVPKPEIHVSCVEDQTYCMLTCNGDTADAEPVTYWWKVGEGNWEKVGKILTGINSDSKLIQNNTKCICKLKNAVSEEESEAVGPLFETKNIPLGGEFVLKPDSTPNSLSSILWRVKQNKVADFDRDFGTDITYYGDFKGRTTLDTTTGELRITGLKKSDEGVYSVELNSVWLEKTYTLSVMNAVPKPEIHVSCVEDQTYCMLTCNGDTADAEPVTYWWKVGEGNWEKVGKILTVINSDSKLIQNNTKCICKLKNAVSEEESEAVGPLFKPSARG
ncbi:hypothetical protein DPEC_G00152600 [Dallia pectoralis]|uniref:Uncharacterized protein n=1 Tax=Dallia pectoralis TaxID=75939 RepID=A0ACC2GJP7_DALPE|nr:hypothetical protein DPEC_G00152600 [Dallia pectoralis]